MSISISHLVINYLSPLLAFITGLYAFRRMSLFWRLLFWQVFVYVLTIPILYAVTAWQRKNGIKANDGVIYNFHMPVEALLLAAAAYYYFSERVSRLIVMALLVFFIVACFIFMSFGKVRHFNIYVCLSECMLLTVLYTSILYKIFIERADSIMANPAFWACLGLLIYAACIVPYFSMYSYFIKHDEITGSFLFRHTVDIVANIRYFLLAFAFWQLRRQPVSNTAITYG